jgi:hypothetical protein
MWPLRKSFFSLTCCREMDWYMLTRKIERPRCNWYWTINSHQSLDALCKWIRFVGREMGTSRGRRRWQRPLKWMRVFVRMSLDVGQSYVQDKGNWMRRKIQSLLGSDSQPSFWMLNPKFKFVLPFSILNFYIYNSSPLSKWPLYNRIESNLKLMFRILTQHVDNMPRAMSVRWATIRIVDATVLTIYWFMVYEVVFVRIIRVCQQRLVVVRIAIRHCHQRLVCCLFEDFSLKLIRKTRFN